MANWQIDPAFVAVSGRISAQELETLKVTLRYREKGAAHSPAYRAGYWDGYRSLLRTEKKLKRLVFPAGLYPRVVAAFLEAGLAPPPAAGHLVLEPRAGVAERDEVALPNGTILYPDQAASFRVGLKQQRGLLHLAPNFGKTELLAAWLDAWAPRQALVLVDRQALLQELTTRLPALLKAPVTVLHGRKSRYERRARVAVGTVQSMHGEQAVSWLKETQVLLVDEVDTVSPASWFPVLGACLAQVRLGVSGSVKEAPQPLVTEAFFGPLLHVVTEQELVDAKRSSDVTVLMVEHQLPPRYSATYQEAYNLFVAGSKSRNSLTVRIVKDCVAAKLKTLVLVYRVEHGAWLTRAFQAAGVPAMWVYGQTALPVIEEAKRAFQDGKLPVLVASTIFNRGVNLPVMNVQVNAAGWKSQRATSQKAARVARRKPESEPQTALVVDIMDVTHPALRYKQGNEEERLHVLERHARSRRHTYRKKGYTVKTGSWEQLAPHLINKEAS